MHNIPKCPKYSPRECSRIEKKKINFKRWKEAEQRCLVYRRENKMKELRARRGRDPGPDRTRKRRKYTGREELGRTGVCLQFGPRR